VIKVSYELQKVENETGSIVIWADNDTESPREWDNLGTFVTWQNRYISPDEHNYGEPRDFLVDIVREAETSYTDEFLEEKATMSRLFEIAEKHYIILPVYVYEHSGRVFDTHPFSCRWDSGQVGYIYVSKEKVRKEYGVKVIGKHVRESVGRILNGEVKTYEKWAEGGVWGFTFESYIEDNVEGSCGGFYSENVKETVREYIDIAKEKEHLYKELIELLD
jgi:hypothetical protein